jgi:hypothetical protein
MPDTFDIHAIARGSDGFQLVQITLRNCSVWASDSLARAESCAWLGYKAQFDEEPAASFAWATESA